jgi:hypothetical protein
MVSSAVELEIIMFVSGRRQASFEMILDRIDRQDERIEELLKKPSNFSGIVPGLLSAGSSVNGTITLMDVLVSGSMAVVGTGAGAITTIVLYATGVEWNDAVIAVRGGAIFGSALCTIKLTVDGLLYDWLNRPKEERLDKPIKPASRPLPLYHSEHQPPATDKVQLLPNNQEITMSDLRNFLETATALYDRWGTKSWAREAWTEGGVVGYPSLGNLKTRVWAGVRELCADWAKGFLAFSDGAGKSTVWQTNDRVLIEQFIEMLEGDDDA